MFRNLNSFQLEFQSQEVDGSLVFDQEQPTEEFEEEATLYTEGFVENGLIFVNNQYFVKVKPI